MNKFFNIYRVNFTAARRALKLDVIIFCIFWPKILMAQSSVEDPSGSGPIVGALQWLQGTLLGTVATVAAVIAVAAVGFMMLTGRMNWRYGAVVILGCFILFGAASIVGGIQSTASAGY
ncbi:TrbC/VirB2 family protein [Sphingobium scionense]|uniref:Type IV secretion system protein VirB2 n=1 Tax=Sphingobium scionense TaxID=1404341 RepID=A0A7W6LTJ7_9SPHN|nr:TrbC/VirB2 family protein [Sphingobium scionense]MBB4150204.1 type IV secretion system protein VirB2 [Sphingobium scionense]